MELLRHIFEKSVIMNADGNIQYEVYSLPVNVEKICLPKIIHDIDSISQILQNFKNMPLCRGINSANLCFIPCKNVFKSSFISEVCRHSNCELLSQNNSRCIFCQRLRKSLHQREKRLSKIRKGILPNIPDSVHQYKLNAMRKKFNSQRRQANRLKN